MVVAGGEGWGGGDSRRGRQRHRGTADKLKFVNLIEPKEWLDEIVMRMADKMCH